MYFKINIILIILSYQCINVLASNYVAGVPGRYNCYVTMPKVDYGYMPLPFQGNVSKPTILRPDGEGNYLFTHNTLIKLSCPGSHFTSPTKYPVLEMNILCLNGFLLYRNRPVTFNSFVCKEVPVSSMKLTRMTCQKNENNSVLEVGFQSKTHFLRNYRICYDINIKNTLYSWYFVDSPLNNIKQVQISRPSFIGTKLLDGINLTSLYPYEIQKDVVEANFNTTDSRAMGDKLYFKSHLTPGQLLSPEEFIYVSEQHSTYFYENTVPMWTRFHTRVWKLLLKLFRRNLTRGSARHLIVAGTYNQYKFPDKDGVNHPVFLAPERRIPVPEFVWKMVYDTDRRSGTVFVGYNHQFQEKNATTKPFCDPVPCPGHFTRDSMKKLVFCCTKESFEAFHGPFDPVIYRQF